MRTRFLFACTGLSLVALFAGAACRGGEASDGDGGSGAGGGLSDATVLDCPYPGALPFATETTDFQDEANAGIAEESTRSKDESSDTLGLPGGIFADTTISVDGAAATGPIHYRGKKGRTVINGGLSSFPLPGEVVSLWYFDPANQAWQTLGRGQTDGFGVYDILPDAPLQTALGQPVYAVLEGDGSCAYHYDFMMPTGTKFVLTDIDGTMTLADEELFKQIDDGNYDPVENKSASALMNAWADKGYFIVYLTARPHYFRVETRSWLKSHGFPLGPVVTANSLVFDESARTYKRSWATRMLQEFGWSITAAYGNAFSDVDAYEDAAIPKDITFTVGEANGTAGTVGIPNNDFTGHIADFVMTHPDA